MQQIENQKSLSIKRIMGRNGMGRNGYGSKWPWAEMVMGRNDPEPYASACVLRNKMTCAMKLDYSEEEVRNVNLTL